MKRLFTFRVAPALAALALLFAGTGPAQRALADEPDANSLVVPLNDAYPELAAEFWKWLYSMPVNKHPLFDTADCSAGQPFDDVWFLGGTFSIVGDDTTAIGVAERDCTVPAGTALFFPIINVACSVIEGDHLNGEGTVEENLRQCANSIADAISFLECEIDGVSVNNLKHYRVETDLFTFGPLPAHNVLQSFGVDARKGDTSDAVADGVHLLVKPLSPGEHVIRFAGGLDFGTFVFALDITYNLTVE